MKYLRAVIAFTAAPVVAWINSWLDLFAGTGLAHPHWQIAADNLATALAAVVSLVTVVVLAQVSKRTNFGVLVVFAVVFLIGIGSTVWARHETIYAPSAEEIEMWKERWQYIYVATLVLMTQTVTGAVLWLWRNDSNG